MSTHSLRINLTFHQTFWLNSLQTVCFLPNKTEIPDIKNLKFQVRYPITHVSAEGVLDISSCQVSVFESKFNTAVRTH